MSPRLLPFAALFGIAVATSTATAATPTKKECAAANEAAQDARSAGRLREARASLAICTAATCPGPIREDCAQRLKDVEAAIPSVVFVVRDTGGHDLSAVRVTMDGEPLLQKLDGAAIAIDPGEHHFGFESEGLVDAESSVLVREGESHRQVSVVLKSAAAPEPTEAPVAIAPRRPNAPEIAPMIDGSTRRALGLSIGAAGVAGVVVGSVFGILAKSTYDRALKTECDGIVQGCTSDQGVRDGKTAHSQADVSTWTLAGAGALLAGGALLYFTAPKADDMLVSAMVSDRGGALSLSGTW